MKNKEQTFEEALAELENSIDKLESDDLTLEKALAYFEKGIGFIRRCDEHLKKADGSLRELLKDENGQIVEKIIGVNLGSVLGGEEFNG